MFFSLAEKGRWDCPFYESSVLPIEAESSLCCGFVSTPIRRYLVFQ